MVVSDNCKFNHFGHCKFGNQCTKKHMDKTCPTFKCQVEDCYLRHPRLCKFFTQFGRCKFGQKCSYFHPIECKSQSLEILALKVEIENLIVKVSGMEDLVLRLGHLENEIESLRKHTNSAGNVFNKFDQYKYPCDVCDFACDSSSELDKHVKTDHEEPPDIQLNEKDFKCEMCSYETTSLKGLNIHKGAKHKKLKKSGATSARTSSTSTATLKPPMNCVRSDSGCTNLINNYFSELTAICNECKVFMDNWLKTSPFPANLCPCCHETSPSA